MYKATREFIKNRQPHVDGFSIRVIENVKRVGGGEANKCYSNSHKAKEEAAKEGKKVYMISGWLVQPYNEKTNSVSILAHWWNADETGQHFDTSPLVNDAEEYVQDSEIYKFCLDNNENLSTHLPFSLLYQNEAYEILIDFENMLFSPIKDLRTENLFKIN